MSKGLFSWLLGKHPLVKELVGQLNKEREKRQQGDYTIESMTRYIETLEQCKKMKELEIDSLRERCRDLEERLHGG